MEEEVFSTRQQEEGGPSPVSLEQENGRLSQELAQANADKDFVWSLWKQLQKESPDMVATVDMVVTREKLKHEQRNEQSLVSLQVKDKEIATLKSLLAAREQEFSDLRANSRSNEEQLGLLESKVQALQSETEKQAHQTTKALSEKETLTRQFKDLKNMVDEVQQAKEELAERCSKQREENGALCKEVAELSSKAAVLSSECSNRTGMCTRFERQLKEKEQLLLERTKLNERMDSELKKLRCELKDMRASRDSWANHTTQQTTTIHRLQSENNKLKADVTAMEERLQFLSESGDMLPSDQDKGKKPQTPLAPRSTIETPSSLKSTPKTSRLRETKKLSVEVHRLSLILEKTERELFETKTLLKAKSKELKGVRCSHDRRLQRMQALQGTHKLVLEQLKTYETKDKPQKFARQIDPKVLTQEDSEAVWNELSHYKTACEELVKQKLLLEEERDNYNVKCLRKQTTIAELQAALSERNDLERKLSAIIAVEPVLPECTGHQQEIEQLQAFVEELRQSNKELLEQERVYKKEMDQLRDQAADKPSDIKYITKSTMTDIPNEGSNLQGAQTPPPRHISEMKNVSTMTEPLPQNRTQTMDVSTMTDLVPFGNAIQPKIVPQRTTTLHTRTLSLSDGEVLLNRKSLRRARDVVSEGETETSRLFVKTKRVMPRKAQHCCSPQYSKANEEAAHHKGRLVDLRAETHRCTWRQEVKTLNQRLRSLSKHVEVITYAKLSLAQRLEEETSKVEKLRTEALGMSLRLQRCKNTIQNLQAEKHKMLVSSKVMQATVQRLEAEVSKRNPKDTEMKLKEYMSQYLSLKAKVKALEDAVKTKDGELHSLKESSAKLERGVKQKRQLIENLQSKLKQVEESSSETQAKYEHLLDEVTGHADATQQNKHKMGLLRLQLSKQTEDKERLMELLASCQEELAHSIQQLRSCQESSERKRQLDAQAKKSLQQCIEQLKTDFSGKISLTEQQLQEHRDISKEFHEFVKVFSTGLEENAPTKRGIIGLCVHDPTYRNITENVRSIARASLNLSELELDEFFQDTEVTKDKQSFMKVVMATATSKPPFAAKLAKLFMDFLYSREVCG